MILTRSIRRKLVIGLAVVFLMVLLLSMTGLSSLHAYWSVVSSLRNSRSEDPRRSDLLEAATGLLDSIRSLSDFKEEDRAVPQTPGKPDLSMELTLDDRMWDERMKVVQQELSEFYRRWELSAYKKGNAELYRLTETKLNSIKIRLRWLNSTRRLVDDIRRLQANSPDANIDFDPHELAVKLQHEAARLQTLVRDIPKPRNVVDSILQESWDAIELRLWLIGAATAVVVILFFCLSYFGYHWILIPVRQLHEAASRVANGSYTYRLKLRGKDEMVELGEMFNKMTERFQTDKSRLDREVKERSRQMIQNQRLAGIGFFASGVAHEINNPLQAIGAAAESLTERLKDGSLGQSLPKPDHELLETYLGMIEREAIRCQQITARVLDFARGTNGPKTRQDLTKIVIEVLEMVSHMSKYDGRTILFDRTTPHFVDISPAEMKQVVLNLVANGLEAMNGKGTLTIQIDETIDEVVLSVKDDGCGMTAAVIENLYEPFFTEKLNGKGTGLGLSITHRIVGDHGGRIEASSDGPGKGSTFCVHLPRCAKSAKSSAA